MGNPIPSKARELASTQPPGEVKVFQGLTPVECVRQGKPISEAAYMKPMALTKTDGIFLLENGCSKQDIKRMYCFKHDAALYARLKSLGLHPWPQKTEAQQICDEVAAGNIPDPQPEELPGIIKDVFADSRQIVQEFAKKINDAFITDPVKIAEFMAEPAPETPPEIYKDFTWFRGVKQQEKPQTLTVNSDGGFVISTKVRKSHINCPMAIGLHKDGQTLVIKPDAEGIKVIAKNKVYSDPGFYQALANLGIEFPAVYELTFSEPEQIWAGVLLP